MQCTKCLETIEPDSKFCKHCGAAVGTTVESAALSAAAIRPATTADDKAPNPYRDPAHEKQVWEGRPAWRASYGAWVLWGIGSVALVYGVHRWHAGETAGKAAWLVIAAAALVLFVRQSLYCLGQRYRLTTQRLFIHRGILTKVTDQMELVRVDDVRLRQGIMDRLVNTGDVEIIGSDKTDENVWLESVSGPAEVAEALRRNVRAARGKGTLFVENV